MVGGWEQTPPGLERHMLPQCCMSSSRHAVHRRIRLSGSGEKPFFPLCSSRSTGPTHPDNSARLPAPGLAAFAPSGIILIRSLDPGSSSLDFCPNSFLAVPFVVSVVYDTVVLGHCAFSLRESWVGMYSIRSRLGLRQNTPQDLRDFKQCTVFHGGGVVPKALEIFGLEEASNCFSDI